MAEKRMFAKTIIDSDYFLDMPISARLLYYDLAMRADDDGFINAPKKIMRIVGASEDDLRILVARQFVIPFESGVVVIRHWRIHNYIQKDRYHETQCVEERSMLSVGETGTYEIGCTQNVSMLDTKCVQAVDEMDTQIRVDKTRVDKTRLESKRFRPPMIEEVKAYCQERRNGVNAERFVSYYESNGWRVGKNPMKDWKAAIRTWEVRDGYEKVEPKQKTPEESKAENDRLALMLKKMQAK